jgi:hypothetical protein
MLGAARRTAPRQTEPLSAADFHTLLVRAFDLRLEPLGFQSIVALKWVRGDGGPIRQVIELSALKGLGRSPRWGVSLQYVPHIAGNKLSWHRSARGARIDLGYDPLDYYNPLDMTAVDWRISPFADDVAQRAALVAGLVVERAMPWLDAAADPEQLVAAFKREEVRQAVRFNFDNYVQYRLAFAFTLARLGQAEIAGAEFDRWVARNRPSDELRGKLNGLLASTGSRDIRAR